MKRKFYVNSIPHFKGWETCFRFLMEKSDTFKIIFQGDANTLDAEGLNAGKKDFLALPLIAISPYKGMENSIEVAGELSEAAQELFQNFMASSFEGFLSDLWSFQFLKGNDVMLEVADFTEGWLYLEESERKDLLAQGVDATNLEEMDSFSAEGRQSDVEVLSWSKDDSYSLGEMLQKALLADTKNVPPEDDLSV